MAGGVGGRLTGGSGGELASMMAICHPAAHARRGIRGGLWVRQSDAAAALWGWDRFNDGSAHHFLSTHRGCGDRGRTSHVAPECIVETRCGHCTASQPRLQDELARADVLEPAATRASEASTSASWHVAGLRRPRRARHARHWRWSLLSKLPRGLVTVWLRVLSPLDPRATRSR